MRNENLQVRMMRASLCLRARTARRVYATRVRDRAPDAEIARAHAILLELRNAIITCAIAADTGQLVYPIGAGPDFARKLAQARAKRDMLAIR